MQSPDRGSRMSHTRHYSIDELLHMRVSLPVIRFPIRKVNKEIDLESIFRVPDEALKSPDKFSCLTRSLASLSKQRKTQQSNKRRMAESSAESSYQGLSESRATLEPIQVQWNLRRRESSDRSSQPHSAPSGADAQQSENFQRFYQAVVSPTHIRVTAGGRIVPNTRVPASLSTDWYGDNVQPEQQKQAIDPDTNPHQIPAWYRNQHVPMGFPHGVPGAFLQPVNFLPQGNGYPMLAMPPHIRTSSSTGESNIHDGAQMGKFNVEMNHGPIPTGPGPQPIKLSPPTQFDQTRPFTLNGQTVYPLPPGYQVPANAVPVPIGMLGASNFLPPGSLPPSPSFLQTGFPIPLPAIPGPMMFPPGQQPTMMMPNQTHQAEAAVAPAGYFPMPSVIPIKDFLIGQINMFGAALKHVNNQIANNKHQIDENGMEQRRADMQNQLKNLEAMLQLQLGQNTKPVESALVKSDPIKPATAGVEAKAPSVVDSQSIARSSSLQPPLSIDDTPATYKQVKGPVKPKIAYESKDTNSTSRSEMTSKARLTIAAANAPPFQPRAQAVSNMALPTQSTQSKMEDQGNLRLEDQAEIQARLLSKSTSDWGQPIHMPVVGMGPVSHSHAQSMLEQPTQAHYNAGVPSFHRSDTVHGQNTLLTSNIPCISPNAVPYLIGTLRNGIQAHPTHPENVMYQRPLTSAEIQARELYWGKNPRPIHSGLPKFDGKDFYPASPVKKSASLSLSNLATYSKSSQELLTANSQSFENLFTETEVPGYRISGSGKSSSKTSSAIYNSQSSFENSYESYSSLSSKESAAKLGLSAISNSSADITNDFQSVGPPSSTFARTRFSNAGVECDFSKLFLEDEVSGRRTNPPLTLAPSRRDFRESNTGFPVTPTNPDFPKDRKSTPDSTKGDSQSTTSTVEIHLSPQNKKISPKRNFDATFAERVENFRNPDQQTLFLQNMLKNTTQTGMVGSAVSGAISSATAQGYLPQFHGSAAASLAPAMLNLRASDHENERMVAKDGGPSPLVVSSFLPENLPFNRDRVQRHNPTTSDILGAEDYMRYVTQKDGVDRKATEPGLNAVASAASPAINNGW